MFTGLVEATGRITEVVPRRGATRIGISSALPAAEIRSGESVAVDGVCLTVAGRRGNRILADAVAETLARTTLGSARVGDRVNLERALRVGDRLGGHLILGHVDCVARVTGVSRRGADVRLTVERVASVARYIVEKGSVALQGVSLTVSGVAGDSFEVALVPETLERTTLGRIRAGDGLNVEADVIARYLEGLSGSREKSSPGPESLFPGRFPGEGKERG